MMKDLLDLKIVLSKNCFDFLSKIETPLTDARTIYDTSRMLTQDLLKKIQKEVKLSKSQISRVFDIAFLTKINWENESGKSAYSGFLQKKTQRLFGQLLYTKIKEKYVEYEGKIFPVNYTQFGNSPEHDKKLNEIFKFNLDQYQKVLSSYKKNPQLEESVKV